MKRTLRYWIAPSVRNAPTGNVRAETQREVAEQLVALGLKRADDGQWYRDAVPVFGVIRKVEVGYSTAFDLVRKALGVSGIE